MKTLAALSLVLLAAGCATGPVSAPSSTPAGNGAERWVAVPVPPSSRSAGVPVSLPEPVQRARHLALQEWELWGQGRWDLASNRFERPATRTLRREEEPPFVSRVLHYWQALAPRGLAQRTVQNGDGTLRAWSAVWVSWLMRSAALGGERFPGSEQHWSYIRAIVQAGSRVGFEALDAARHAPQVGDLICAPRESAIERVPSFEQLRQIARVETGGMPFHCDFVVEVSAGRAGAIGGNVNDAVVWTDTPLSREGLLLATAERPWLLLLRAVSEAL